MWQGRKWPSDRAMASIRAAISGRTGRRHMGRLVEAVLADLNPVSRGWSAYFRWGNPREEVRRYGHIRPRTTSHLVAGRTAVPGFTHTAAVWQELAA